MRLAESVVDASEADMHDLREVVRLCAGLVAVAIRAHGQHICH